MHDALHLSARAFLTLGLLTVAPAAGAHGAFPAVRQLVADPSDANRLWARAAHGVLTSDDQGATWRWLCTAAAGYGGTEEPTLALTGNGTALMAAFHGLLASSDHGCGWALPDALLVGSAPGVAVDAKNADRVLVLISGGAGGGAFESSLWQSLDAGATWKALSPSLDTSTLFTGVGLSSSDASRLYLTGSKGGKSVVVRSDDAGKTWQAPLELATAGTAQVAAVHPTNPDVVYLRVGGWGTSGSEGAVLHSGDGAKSFSEVLRKSAPLMGLTLSPDGAKLFAAYGNPRGGVKLDEAALGLYSATTADHAFTRVHDTPVACATFVAGELWACTSQFDDGFEIGRSSDDGKTFAPVMELAALDGPLECAPSSTVGTTCTAAGWDDVCRDIGKCTDTTPAEESSDDGGCGCRSARGRAGGALAVLWLALLAALRRTRR